MKTNRIFMILSIIPSIAVIVLSVLQIFGVWKDANNVSIPLLGVIGLCQSIAFWNENRRVAILELIMAVFIFICAAIIWIL